MKYDHCSIQDSREWELLVRYKSVWKFVWWVLAFKMLVSTLLVILLSTIALSKNPSGSCGCPTETIHSFNEARIPARITEWVCNQTGATCGATNMSKVSIRAQPMRKATNSKHFLLQCHQLTGLLDVGYTVKIDEEEMVVYRRNLTVGIGCSCKARTVQRVVQPERIYHL